MTPVIPLLRRAMSLLSLLVLALTAAGCAPSTASTNGPAPQTTPGPHATLDALYQQAIQDASVYRAGHVLPLNGAVADAAGNVRVVTFTSWGGWVAGTDTV